MRSLWTRIRSFPAARGGWWRRPWWSFVPTGLLLAANVLYLSFPGNRVASVAMAAAFALSFLWLGWTLLAGRWHAWRLSGLNSLDHGDLEHAEEHFRACRRVGWLLPRRSRIPVLRGLVEVARRRGNLAAAEHWSRQLLRVEQSVFGSQHRHCAAALNNLACLCQSQEKHGDALDLYQRSIEIWLQAGPEEADCAVTLRNLGQLHGMRGNHAAAEPCLRRALAIQEKIVAPPAELSLSRRVLAQSCLAQGQAEEAEWLLRRACRAAIEAWGQNDAQVAQLRSDLAQLYAAQGRYGEADEWFRLSLETLRTSSGLSHPEAAGVLEKYADFLRQAADIPPDAAQC